MRHVTLPTPLGNERVDLVLQAVIAIYEAAFPDQILGYYVDGSYADQTSVSGSDIDLTIVLDEGAAHDVPDRIQQIASRCSALAKVEIDVGSSRPVDFAPGLPPQLKFGSVLLLGTDVRDRFPVMPMDAWTRDRMHTSYWRIASLFGRPKIVRRPLDYPDPRGEFYGYDARTIPFGGAQAVPSTRDLVRSVGWAATALVALRAGRYVTRKRDSHLAYRDVVGDGWTEWLDELMNACRQRWQYRVPETSADRQSLRRLCARTLAFERHYLVIYRRYLIGELRSADVERQLAALRPVTYAPWFDTAIEGALSQLCQAASQPVQQAARTGVQRYHAAAAATVR